MLITKKNQTPQELAREFIEAMKKTESGSEDMNIFFDSIVANENKNIPDEKVIAAVKNVCNTGFDATQLPFIINNKINISMDLLLWISIQSSGIPEYITTMIGLYAVEFYSKHHRTEKLTLKWVGDTVGKGKLVGFRQFYPWASVAKTEDGKNIFDLITEEDIFTYDALKQ